jgi:hypothetical protein
VKPYLPVRPGSLEKDPPYGGHLTSGLPVCRVIPPQTWHGLRATRLQGHWRCVTEEADSLPALQDELRYLLNRWDPIGVYDELTGFPLDEYDCLLGPC